MNAITQLITRISVESDKGATMPHTLTQRAMVEIGHTMPAFEYNISGIHYADCTCYACIDAHFPCDDLTCDYCNTVRSLRDNDLNAQERRWLYIGHERIMPLIKVAKECGSIIGYQAYLSWPNDYVYDYSDLVWSECKVCEILISGYERDTYNNCCGEYCRDRGNTCPDCDCEISSDHYRCRRCHQVHNKRYCYLCGDTLVRYSGEMCKYCEDDEDEDREDDSGYISGDIVREEDYSDTENCWIDPSGNVRYVPYCNHDYTANKLGFGGVGSCERAGYIHVSIYWDSRAPFVHIPQRPTNAQKRTVQLYAEQRGVKCPESCAMISYDEPRGIVAFTYSVYQSIMPRRMRDIFYPLSGD